MYGWEYSPVVELCLVHLRPWVPSPPKENHVESLCRVLSTLQSTLYTPANWSCYKQVIWDSGQSLMVEWLPSICKAKSLIYCTGEKYKRIICGPSPVLGPENVN
jgi:hypothetical protein